MNFFVVNVIDFRNGLTFVEKKFKYLNIFDSGFQEEAYT